MIVTLRALDLNAQEDLGGGAGQILGFAVVAQHPVGRAIDLVSVRVPSYWAGTSPNRIF